MAFDIYINGGFIVIKSGGLDVIRNTRSETDYLRPTASTFEFRYKQPVNATIQNTKSFILGNGVSPFAYADLTNVYEDNVAITKPASADDLALYLDGKIGFFFNPDAIEVTVPAGDSIDVALDSQTGAFGALATFHKNPIVQIANKYQIDPNNLDEIEIFTATGGSADNNGNLFRCQTGTSVGGYGVLRSSETLNYTAGQGVESMLTASFTAGVALSLQFAGMFNISDTVAFGYDGADFSCLHSYGGVSEVQMITVTATGAGTNTVTLDGTASSGITVTNSDVQTNAEEIRAGLAVDAVLASLWRFEQVDDMVFCISKGVGNKTGSMSITGGVTANIAEQTAGVSQTDGHIAQASWNVTTSPFVGFDPTQLNIYKVQFGYLGVANINYYIYNPLTGKFVLVHQIEWANANNTTHISSPNFKVGWTSASLGASGTNLTVEGASASIFLEGDEIIKGRTFGDSNSVTGVGTTDTAILTIKNRIVYGDRFNLGKVFPISVSVDNDHTKGLIVDLYRNTILGGVTNYQYENEFNSLVIIDKSGTTSTNGSLVESFTVEKGSDTIIDLTTLNTEILPEETFSIVARTISGSGAVVTASITWDEKK